MRIIDTCLFYIFFCSATLIYGIGTLQAAETSLSRKRIALTAFKSLCCVLTSVSITKALSQLLLVPLSLAELYPLAALLLFTGTSVFFEIIFQLTSKKSSSEFTISFLTVLLALNEGESLLDSIAISVCCLASYCLLIPLLRSFTSKLARTKRMDSFKQKTTVFLCMVVITMALFALNISWINAGV